MGLISDPLTDDLFAPSHPVIAITLQGHVDLQGFRHAARQLLAQHISPEHVSWYCSNACVQDLFTPVLEPHHARSGNAPAIRVPPEFVALCQTTLLHSDASRFGLLYRLLWRLLHEHGLRHDPLDADRVQAQRMAQAVRRDMHKMKAFVRFRTVQDDQFKNRPEDGPLHVAWFEPEHHIVEAIAPFFARRFTQMRWAILTPQCSVQWNGPGGTLGFGPGAKRHQAPPPDAGEQLWLTYYQHIFNPARLKFKMMQKEMPRKYWHNLPEAQLIYPLAAQAYERSAGMLTQPATTMAKRMPAASAALAKQPQSLGNETIGAQEPNTPSELLQIL